MNETARAPDKDIQLCPIKNAYITQPQYYIRKKLTLLRQMTCVIHWLIKNRRGRQRRRWMLFPRSCYHACAWRRWSRSGRKALWWRRCQPWFQTPCWGCTVSETPTHALAPETVLMELFKRSCVHWAGIWCFRQSGGNNDDCGDEWWWWRVRGEISGQMFKKYDQSTIDHTTA